MPHIRRRQFLSTAGVLLAAPAGASAQQPQRVHRIGFFYFGTREAALATGRYEAFLEGLRKLGYEPGKNLSIDEHFGDSKVERLTALASQVVRGKPDVIVATGSPTYEALRGATQTIPIIVTVTVDPVAVGLAKTLARPGSNFTGLTDTALFLGPKQVELLVAAEPGISRVAVLSNPDNNSHAAQLATMQSEARTIGKQVLQVDARTRKELEAGFATMARQRADAVIVLGDTLFTDHFRTIADLARFQRLPAAHASREFVVAGGLMSYGPNFTDNFRRAAIFVDRILKGANPAEMPFEQPTQYYLIINLQTAKALGITISQSLLLRADEVIR